MAKTTSRSKTKKSTAKTLKKSAKKRPSKGGGVRVRMYRLGVGDCFLLTFPRADSTPFRILIDCGVHQSQTGGGDLIKKVVADIKQETGGAIDVVVGTHEHWDHISGFSQAAALFKELEVGEVWAAWTENARDTFAKSLLKKRANAIAVLGKAEARMRLAGRTGSDNPLTGLLGFFGDTTGKKLQEAGRVLAALAGGKSKIRYREPGEPPIEIPGFDARIFVLGPPRDKKAIGRSDPRKDGDEVYSFGAYAAALEAIEPALATESAAPFDSRFALPLQSTKKRPFFKHHYWAERDATERRERVDNTQGWRRIDDDWLEAATTLALKLDEDTNNTSLVLAIELGDAKSDGLVLLFAADAQVGNWLSWQNVAWDYRGRHITGPDLLRRTVIYKVGHHASHNATLQAQGLELMDSLSLALVPTDDKMAKKVGWGTLPWPKLLERLAEKTANRVLRTDRPFAAPLKGFKLVPTDLYYEIEL
jgi:hypothetical protein